MDNFSYILQKIKSAQSKTLNELQQKRQEKVGSKVRTSQSYLCMEAVPRLLNAPAPEGAHQDTPERAGQAQLPKTSVRPTTGIVVY